MANLAITTINRTIALGAFLLVFPTAASSAECDHANVLAEVKSMIERERLERSSLAPPNSANAARLANLVDLCGWPGVSQIGQEAALGAFLVLQHADLPLQLRLAPLLRISASEGELVPGTLPLLEDRMRVRQGLPQLYGSQFKGTGEPYPIEDPDNLDARRKAAGLVPYAEYRKQINKQ